MNEKNKELLMRILHYLRTMKHNSSGFPQRVSALEDAENVILNEMKVPMPESVRAWRERFARTIKEGTTHPEHPISNTVCPDDPDEFDCPEAANALRWLIEMPASYFERP